MTFDAARFEDVHHAGGPGVAEAQSALEEGGAALLLLPRDFDAAHDEFFIGRRDIVLVVSFVAAVVDGALDVALKIRRRLGGAVVDQALDFLVGHEGTLRALQLRGAGRQVEHVALADELLRSLGIEDHAGVELRGDLEGDAAGDVCLDDDCDHVGAWSLRGDDQVNASGAGFLGDAGDAAFDICGSGLHEVGKLVDENDNVGEAIRNFVVIGDDVFFVFFGSEFARFERSSNGLDGFQIHFGFWLWFRQG